jgi:hypothetical protein
MSRDRDIARLEELARLMLDHRLARLSDIAAQRDRSRIQIAALSDLSDPADLPSMAAEQVSLRYQQWADTRRSELNAVLARQTAEWIEARQEAQHAFGRAEALRTVAKRLGCKLRATGQLS